MSRILHRLRADPAVDWMGDVSRSDTDTRFTIEKKALSGCCRVGNGVPLGNENSVDRSCSGTIVHFFSRYSR